MYAYFLQNRHLHRKTHVIDIIGKLHSFVNEIETSHFKYYARNKWLIVGEYASEQEIV